MGLAQCTQNASNNEQGQLCAFYFNYDLPIFDFFFFNLYLSGCYWEASISVQLTVIFSVREILWSALLFMITAKHAIFITNMIITYLQWRKMYTFVCFVIRICTQEIYSWCFQQEQNTKPIAYSLKYIDWNKMHKVWDWSSRLYKL